MNVVAKFVALAVFLISVQAVPSTWLEVSRRNAFPFDRVVAFGDNLSDNGNGSSAHGAAKPGDPHNKIYGYSTWTNGPVAVSYLAHDLGKTLINYAYGHAAGGKLFGATVDNDYTESEAHAPSTKDQINAYIDCESEPRIAATLHFLWTGNNDINLDHIDTAVGSNNTQFAIDMAGHIGAQVQTLLNAGAVHVFVPSLYAKHLSPSKRFYAKNTAECEVLGETIQSANEAVKAKLAAWPKRVIFYDVFETMVRLWDENALFGINNVGDSFCDGYSQQDWTACVEQGDGDAYYWMQYLDMTTRVHYVIAQDMLATIKARFDVY